MEIKYLQDINGNKILPVTSASAVRDANGNNVEESLTNLKNFRVSTQSSIIQLDNRIADTYTKQQVSDIISNTPETDVIVIEVPTASQNDIAGWLDANTPSGTDPETGKSVRANKLYRVPGPDNTTYSEWAWDGTAYIMLANKDYSIDNVPKAGNNGNTVKSNGVSQCLFENERHIGFIKSKLNTPLTTGFINKDGSVSASTYGAHTDFIRINHDKKYFVRSSLALNWCTAYYLSNSEESFIESQEYNASSDVVDFPLTIPSGAEYMRVTMQAEPYLPQDMKGVFEYEVRRIGDEIDDIPSEDIVDWLNSKVGYSHVGEIQIVGVEDCNNGIIDINGAISSSEYAVYSDFIEITSVKKYFVRGQGNPGWYYGYYSDKSEQSFISSQQSAPNTTFFEDIELVVPEGARYVRVTLPKNSSYFPIGLFEYTLDDIKTNFDRLSKKIGNALNSIGFVDEKVNLQVLSGFIGYDGNIYQSEWGKHTELIEIDDAKRTAYIVKTVPSMGWCCAFYDNNNNFISSQWYGPNTDSEIKDIALIIPPTAKYISATLSSSVGVGVYVRSSMDIQKQCAEETKNMYDELLNTLGYNYEEIPTTLTSGFINSAGEVEQSSFGKYTDFIPVNPLFDYIVRTWMSPLWYVAYYADSDVNSFISSQQYPENTGEAQDLNLNIPTGAKYLRATIQVGGYGVFMKKISNDSLERTYIVDKSGNGDFTTFYGALRALQNDSSKKKIIVLGGVYDVFEEMGGQAFIDSIPSDAQPSDWRQYCTLIPDNTKVIGQGEVVIKCELPNGTPDNVRIMISPINVSGSVEIENMTIIAANVRYNIHDECSAIPRFNNTSKIYRNVKLWQISSITGTIFGCGFNPNCSYEFHNCIFDGDNAYKALFMHTNAGNDYTSILMSNCVFNVAQNTGESILLRCGAHDNGNAFVTVNMNNVLANKQVHITAGEYANTFKVTAANCNFDSINIEAASNPYTPKFY